MPYDPTGIGPARVIDVDWARERPVLIDGAPATAKIVPGTHGHVDYHCPTTGFRLPGALAPGRFAWTDDGQLVKLGLDDAIEIACALASKTDTREAQARDWIDAYVDVLLQEWQTRAQTPA